MSFFDININDLADSNSIASAIAGNAIPKNGKNILSTSAAARGYVDQTLTSSDLVSAASGKDLLAGGVYGNIYKINMMRESLSSLANTILGSDDEDLKIPSNNGAVDENGNTKILTRCWSSFINNSKRAFG